MKKLVLCLTAACLFSQCVPAMASPLERGTEAQYSVETIHAGAGTQIVNGVEVPVEYFQPIVFYSAGKRYANIKQGG